MSALAHSRGHSLLKYLRIVVAKNENCLGALCFLFSAHFIGSSPQEGEKERPVGNAKDIVPGENGNETFVDDNDREDGIDLE